MIEKYFLFNVNVSVDSYASKKDAVESIATLELAKKNGHKKKMSFLERTVSIDDFERYITSGYSYCGGLFRFPQDYTETFTTKDGGKYESSPYYKDDSSLKAQFKADRNFTCGQVFSIDVDETRFKSPEDYVETLTLKPTFYYTSPSDDIQGKRKFRLVYIFEMLLNKEAYEMATKALHFQIEKDTQEKIKDTCGERFSQYFNGNRNALIWTTYNILQVSDLKPIMDENNIGPEERAENEGIFGKEILTEMETLGYDEFMHFNSLKYEYFWSSVRFMPGENYRILEKGKDFVILFRWGEKFKDGEGRRKRLQKYACLRRIARPDITPDELLFNLYIDRERFFDNSDGAITLDCLKRKVEIAFSKSPEELREEFKAVIERCPVRYLINPKVILKRAASNRARKDIHWREIEDNYDTKKSLKENLKDLQAKGIKVKKTTLYEFCKAKDIDTAPEITEKRKKILALYDSSKTQNENLEILKNSGINITRTGMMKIIKTTGSRTTEGLETEIECCLESSNIIFETEKSFTPIDFHFPSPDAYFKIPDFAF